MNQLLLLTPVVLLFQFCQSEAAVISFSGYDWRVRSGQGGPGPNRWEEKNVWLDASGALHLKIAQRDGQWSCAEVTMQKRLGFGRYDFHLVGPIDRFDENVVLGLFNYPTRDVGPDATHEIDIEFARWGKGANPIGNYTVWPVDKSMKQESHSFSFKLEEPESTHRFAWSGDRIEFRSWRGPDADGAHEFHHWTYSPKDAARKISTQPMPMHFNLWLFVGQPPRDGKEVEIVVQRFTFTPESETATKASGK
jgi:hypothetical protein